MRHRLIIYEKNTKYSRYESWSETNSTYIQVILYIRQTSVKHEIVTVTNIQVRRKISTSANVLNKAI